MLSLNPTCQAELELAQARAAAAEAKAALAAAKAAPAAESGQVAQPVGGSHTVQHTFFPQVFVLFHRWVMRDGVMKIKNF